VYLTLIFKGDI